MFKLLMITAFLAVSTGLYAQSKTQDPIQTIDTLKIELTDYQKVRLDEIDQGEKKIQEQFKSATDKLYVERTKIISLIIDLQKQPLDKVKSVEIDSTFLTVHIIK